MKFQCGKCKKHFTVNNIHATNKDLNFKCDSCDNIFFINRNLAFSSSSKNSRILCENCGKSINENNKVCDSCNLILNKAHEELRIDNRDYEVLEIKQNGHIYNATSGTNITKKSLLIPGIITVFILAITSAWFFYDNPEKGSTSTIQKQIRTNAQKNKGSVETQVVIMKSGQTYYANKIEQNGLYTKITTKDGMVVEIPSENVMQISKAILED